MKKWEKVLNTTMVHITDSRTRKIYKQTIRHILTSKDTYRYFCSPYTVTQWNNLPESCIHAQPVDTFREQLTPTVLCTLI